MKYLRSIIDIHYSNESSYARLRKLCYPVLAPDLYDQLV